MVWEMFLWHSLGHCGRHDRSLQVHICPSGPCPPLHANCLPQNDGIYKQDNARCHTAPSVYVWFEEHQDEFTILPWPANSLDLNMVKNLWDHFNHAVCSMDPQLHNLM